MITLARLSLRWRIPLVLAAMLLTVLALGLLNALERRGAGALQQFEQGWRQQLSTLQRAATATPDGNALVQALAHAATDPALTALAVVNAQGTVTLSQRKAWREQPARSAVPGWDDALATQALRQSGPQVRWDGAHVLRMAQRVDLPAAGGADARGRATALLWITADATRAVELERWRVLRNRMTDLTATALLLLLFGLWLQRRVGRPLVELTEAAEALRDGDLGRRVPAAGLPEIVRLGQVFNGMAASVQRSQAELRTSEQRLGTILYSTGDALLATDAQQRVTLVNKVAEQLTGWREHEARGRPIGEIFVIENALTRQPAEIPVARVLAEGIVVGLANHTVLVARDGSRRHIADSAAPVRDADGVLQGVVLVFRDVTESWRLERALADSEAHYRALADLGPTLVWTADAQGRPTWVNRRWCDYTGQEAGAALAGGWRDALHPDDERSAVLTAERAHLAGQPYEAMLRLRRHDGAWRWMLMHGQPRRDSAGALLGFVHTLTDVTAQRDQDSRRAEELAELQRWRATLLGREARVAELKAEVNALCAAQGQPLRYAMGAGAPTQDSA